MNYIRIIGAYVAAYVGFLVVSTILVFFLTAPLVHGAESLTQKLESKYFTTLDEWARGGGRVQEVQEKVVKTCGKLVMLNASIPEKIALSTTQREEFHFRVDVCTKMTVNRVYKQPEFEKKGLVEMICDESQVTLFRKLCRHSGLR